MDLQKIGIYLKDVRINSEGRISVHEYPQKAVIRRIENNENYMIKSLFGYVQALNHQLYYKNILINSPFDLGNLIKNAIKEQKLSITELGTQAELKRKTIYMLMSGHGNCSSFVKVLNILNININIRKK